MVRLPDLVGVRARGDQFVSGASHVAFTTGGMLRILTDRLWTLPYVLSNRATARGPASA